MNRYARHTILPWFGIEGQKRLASKSVLVVGCGGTGCSCSSFLARAGVGKIVLVDPDVVSITDLHRQVLYAEADLEHLNSKVNSARNALLESNHEPDIEAIQAEFGPQNGPILTDRVDLVVDCSDNFETRMLINDICLKHSQSWVHGACTGTAGMVIPFPETAEFCYRCVVDHIPAGVTSGGAAPGILGPAAGMVGCLEAAEAVKMLVAPESVHHGIVLFDLISNTHESIRVRQRKKCPACVERRYEFLKGSVRRESFDSESSTARVMLSGPLDLGRIRALLRTTCILADVGAALRVETRDAEFLLLADGTAIVRPASDLEQARSSVEDLLKG